MRIGVTAGLVACLSIGAAVGGAARGMRETRTPLPRKQVVVSSDNDGSDPLIVVELEPNAVLSGSRGETLEYSLSIRPRANKRTPVMSKYSVEVRTAGGAEVATPEMSNVISLTPEGGHGKALNTPRGLSDGYYFVRVQAAAADGIEDTLAIVQQYFRVASGRVEPLSGDDYFRDSGINIAHRP